MFLRLFALPRLKFVCYQGKSVARQDIPVEDLNLKIINDALSGAFTLRPPLPFITPAEVVIALFTVQVRNSLKKKLHIFKLNWAFLSPSPPTQEPSISIFNLAKIQSFSQYVLPSCGVYSPVCEQATVVMQGLVSSGIKHPTVR
jgi:hypothetical protein